MSAEVLLPDLQDIMRDIFDDDDLVITMESQADDIDDWDSLTHIQLILAIEKQYNIKFSHGEIEGLKNVGEFLSVLHHKVQS